MTQSPSRKNFADDPAIYAQRSAWFGGIIWIITIAWWHPSPFTPMWITALLLLAPLVLVPLALRLVEPDGTWIVLRAAWRLAIIWQLPAAILLVPAFLLAQGWITAALTLPWLLTTALIAFTGVLRARLLGWRSAADTALNAGLVYLVIGGAWLFLDRLGVRPLNFEAIIVTLTAVHFHYAGFLLPIFTGMAGGVLKEGATRLAAIGVMVGVPLVAMGITATQLGCNPLWEALAAWFTALAGLLAAISHMRLAMRQRAHSVRVFFMLCGLALAFSMVHAALYGARFYMAWPGMELPWMRALHGSVNAFGFGLAGVVGWNLMRRAEAKIS